MDCPNCGVYNPEDRRVCWRCGKELPKPVEPPKKKDPRARTQTILWVAVAVFFVVMILQLCGLPKTLQSSLGTPTPSSYHVPAAPPELGLG